MRIFFTGGTSFTGSWFVRELARAGHEVYALIFRKEEAYSGMRKTRLELLRKDAKLIFDCPFGSETFFKTLESAPFFDFFCHHAAEVTDYKSLDFNVSAALENNTRNLKRTFETMKEKGCGTVVLTGSVFEPGEGAGSDGLRAVSPYGLSKGLTSSFFHYYAAYAGVFLKKFVIPNPFGPREEIRFTTFLAREWLANKIAPVARPSYVRDNIHVSLLAKAYADFLTKDLPQINPSGYVESQGAFTLRFQQEMRQRLCLPCEIELQTQTVFPEPKVRINTDLLEPSKLGWDESKAWDELAEFYLSTYGN